jgi:hypothetical protein
MDLPRARWVAPVWIALLLGGCALTDLDLDGGASVVETRISAGELKLVIDDTRRLALTLIYDDGFEETAPQDTVMWSLDIPAVAAIDGNHQLRARSRGTATLTGQYGKQTATASVEVTDVMQAIEIQTARRNCTVGQQLLYSALLRYQHGSTEDITARAVWRSDAPQVASVEAGIVIGRGAGDTLVRATFSTLTSSADVHVTSTLARRVDATVHEPGAAAVLVASGGGE